jgi:hypothetical protein
LNGNTRDSLVHRFLFNFSPFFFPSPQHWLYSLGSWIKAVWARFSALPFTSIKTKTKAKETLALQNYMPRKYGETVIKIGSSFSSKKKK